MEIKKTTETKSILFVMFGDKKHILRVVVKKIIKMYSADIVGAVIRNVIGALRAQLK